jgi:hypothetical protein
MVFLIENKLRKVKMDSIRSKLGFPNMIVVDCVGRSGGLALMWGMRLRWKFLTLVNDT